MGKPAPADPYDYEDGFNASELSELMRKSIEYGFDEDCGLILDMANIEAFSTVVKSIATITDYLIEGGLAYDTWCWADGL